MDVERLSSLDLSFLGLEDADTPMHLGAVLLFRPATDVQVGDPAKRLAAVLRARAATVPKLRRRLARSGFGPGDAAWVPDPDFDPERHIHCDALPAPGGREQLATRTAELLAAPLDRDRPLWPLHVLAGAAMAGSRCWPRSTTRSPTGSEQSCWGWRCLMTSGTPRGTTSRSRSARRTRGPCRWSASTTH